MMTKEECLQADIERALGYFLGLPYGDKFPTEEWVEIARLFAACCQLSQVSSPTHQYGVAGEDWEIRDNAKQLVAHIGKLTEALSAVVE